MKISDAGKSSPQTAMDYDRAKALKAFDETKTGVKGVVDVGVVL
ncbi:hypothetical protein Patl1_25156 [Pistacia atlantica]|uniref:Uncharacterized protein n=1 Tax=Pistacia atlantica TaxID=434234 RepID=A0ACC1B393_9ROSI|nr:hypothetical protein Patl1_25156 [Pistacia atlantica]